MVLRDILALARSGSPDRAWAAFLAAGWDRRHDDPAVLTLKGRLLKDQARRAAPAERGAFYRQAAAAYAAAAALDRATYPMINAATLAMLGGDAGEARSLATQILALIARGEDRAETAYWREATRAEALLLLDRPDEARDALAAAIVHQPQAWEDHAATIGQFTLILAAQRRDGDWLDRYRPPRSLHFRGIMGIAPDDAAAAARIEAAVAEDQPGFAFGALAAGADILVAEAAVRRGALLHVVLPCPVDEFRHGSVVAVDARWGARFDALIDAAESVDWLAGDPHLSGGAVAVADRMALGLALRTARLLQSEADSLAVDEPAVTAPPPPAAIGARQRHVAVARSAAVPSTIPGISSHPVAVIATGAGTAARLADAAGLCCRAALGEAQLLGFATPGQALTAARRLAGDAPAALALDYGLASDGRIDPALAARAITIASAARNGPWLASRPMALALEAEIPRPRIEIGGEVRGPSGVHPIFTIGAPDPA